MACSKAPPRLSSLKCAPVVFDDSSFSVPLFLVDVFNLVCSDIKAEGLFRKSCNANRVKNLKYPFYGDYGIPDGLNVYDACYLVKQFFREIQEPLLTVPLEHQFLKFHTLALESTQVKYVLELCHVLPPIHRETLAFLMRKLKMVSDHAEYNKMDVTNLATVFCPSIFRGSCVKTDLARLSVQSQGNVGLMNFERTDHDLKVKLLRIMLENAEKIGVLSEYEKIMSPDMYDRILPGERETGSFCSPKNKLLWRLNKKKKSARESKSFNQHRSVLTPVVHAKRKAVAQQKRLLMTSQKATEFGETDAKRCEKIDYNATNGNDSTEKRKRHSPRIDVTHTPKLTRRSSDVSPFISPLLPFSVDSASSDLLDSAATTAPPPAPTARGSRAARKTRDPAVVERVVSDKVVTTTPTLRNAGRNARCASDSATLTTLTAKRSADAGVHATVTRRKFAVVSAARLKLRRNTARVSGDRRKNRSSATKTALTSPAQKILMPEIELEAMDVGKSLPTFKKCANLVESDEFAYSEARKAILQQFTENPSESKTPVSKLIRIGQEKSSVRPSVAFILNSRRGFVRDNKALFEGMSKTAGEEVSRSMASPSEKLGDFGRRLNLNLKAISESSTPQDDQQSTNGSLNNNGNGSVNYKEFSETVEDDKNNFGVKRMVDLFDKAADASPPFHMSTRATGKPSGLWPSVNLSSPASASKKFKPLKRIGGSRPKSDGKKYKNSPSKPMDTVKLRLVPLMSMHL